MATKLSKPRQKAALRQLKYFSLAVKRQTVKDIETGKCTVLEASKELGVSQQSVYRWVYKFSGYLQKNKILVVADKSEGYKTKELERRLREAGKTNFSTTIKKLICSCLRLKEHIKRKSIETNFKSVTGSGC